MTTGRHGEGRDFRSPSSRSLSTPLHSTHDRLLLLKRPHEFCTKSSKQFACRAQFHARNGSSRLLVDLQLGAILTRQLDYCYFYRSNLTTFSLLPFLQHHYINFHIEGFFFHQDWNKTWPYSRALLVKEPCWTVTGTKYTPFSSHQSSHNIHFLETLHISKRVWIYKSSY